MQITGTHFNYYFTLQARASGLFANGGINMEHTSELVGWVSSSMKPRTASAPRKYSEVELDGVK
jgi:hypothetical protein